MSTPPGLEFLDQKVVKPPPQFAGDRAKWKHFNVKLLNESAIEGDDEGGSVIEDAGGSHSVVYEC